MCANDLQNEIKKSASSPISSAELCARFGERLAGEAGTQDVMAWNVTPVVTDISTKAGCGEAIVLTV
jgi:hypothetical protein